MFIKAHYFNTVYGSLNKPVLINTNSIATIETDDEDNIFITLMGQTQLYITNHDALKNSHCEELADLSIKLRQLKLSELTSKQATKRPKELSEICTVTFEKGSVCLVIHKNRLSDACEFKLLPLVERYEFDGDSMYFYKPGAASFDTVVRCSNRQHQNMSTTMEHCIETVKTEMAKQCLVENITITRQISYELSDFVSENRRFSTYD